MIRMTRIVYAFRNKVWPKPMEGLDLFTPVVRQDESSSESSEEEDESSINCVGMRGDEEEEEEEELEERGAWGSGSDSDYVMSSQTVERKTRPYRVKFAGKLAPGGCDEEGFVDIEGEEMRDFEIEKSQGLKITLKKSNSNVAVTSGSESELTQVGIRDVGFCN